MELSALNVIELNRVKIEFQNAKDDLSIKDFIIAQLKEKIVELPASTVNRNCFNMICKPSFVEVNLYCYFVLCNR